MRKPPDTLCGRAERGRAARVEAGAAPLAERMQNNAQQ